MNRYSYVVLHILYEVVCTCRALPCRDFGAVVGVLRTLVPAYRVFRTPGLYGINLPPRKEAAWWDEVQ